MNVGKHIRRFYRISKRHRLFKRRFYELITNFIKQNILARHVDWRKFEYEFKTIGRKCKQKNRSAKCYVRSIAYLVAISIKGHHKKIDSQTIIETLKSRDS